jgi:phage repressor protein C with HTH and peptisase S24 domain
MTVKFLITTGSPEESEQIILSNKTELSHETTGDKEETLGDKEEELSIQMEELLNSVLNQVRKSVKTECEVQISISGKVSLVGQGGAKFIIFNIGGKAAKETTTTITLKSKVLPT